MKQKDEFVRIVRNIKNVDVCLCFMKQQQEQVVKAAKKRGGMIHIFVVHKLPRYERNHVIYRHFEQLGGTWKD